MHLLSFEDVTKRFERGQDGTRERVPVRRGSFAIDAGEVVALVGRARSGRSTVLRLAGGIERPSEGIVRFDGHELVDESQLGVPDGIAFCLPRFSRAMGGPVHEHVASGILSLKLSRRQKSDRVDAALERVGASTCAELDPATLDYGEAIRVALARAIVVGPRILLVDDPVHGVDLAEVDSILLLLRSLARDDGLAVFFTLSSGADLAGARSLTIYNGEIRGKTEPTTADVYAFRRRRTQP